MVPPANAVVISTHYDAEVNKRCDKHTDCVAHMQADCIQQTAVICTAHHGSAICTKRWQGRRHRAVSIGRREMIFHSSVHWRVCQLVQSRVCNWADNWIQSVCRYLVNICILQTRPNQNPDGVQGTPQTHSPAHASQPHLQCPMPCCMLPNQLLHCGLLCICCVCTQQEVELLQQLWRLQRQHR